MDKDIPSKEYKPFEPKPKEETATFKKRKAKWNKQLKETDDSLDHRRFNCTLTVNQVVTSFKKVVRANEIKRDALITCYRVVLEKLLQDPDLTDSEFLSMYKQIQPRAQATYARRSRKLRQIKT